MKERKNQLYIRDIMLFFEGIRSYVKNLDFDMTLKKIKWLSMLL